MTVFAYSPLTNRKRAGASALAMALTLASAPFARAQDAADSSVQPDDTGGVGEIVVTARKRAESAQDVPDAISVLSQQVVEDGSLQQIEDFVGLAPNATFTDDSETSSEISIRGSARNIPDEDPSVGVYRDGVYVGGLLFSTANFYDTERVEILRGPQAALYGRNSVGGAINVVSERPAFNNDGYVTARIGSKSRQEVRGGVNIPLTEDVAALRLSGIFINQDKGFDYIVNQDKYTDAQEVASVRARLLLNITPDLEMLTTVEYLHKNGGQALLVAAPNQEFGTLDSNDFSVIPGTSPEDTDNQFRDWPTFYKFRQFHAFNELNWNADFGTLSALLSYRDATVDLSRDDDYTNFDVSGRRYKASQRSFFSELRFATDAIANTDILVGVNYLSEQLDLGYDNRLGGAFYGALGGASIAQLFATGRTPPQFRAFGIPTGTPISALGLTPGATGVGGYLGDSSNIRFDNKQQLKSFAAFGEATYKIAPALEIWGNARYTRDKKDTQFGQNFVDCPVACPQIIDFLLNTEFEVNGTNSATFENVSVGGGVNVKPSDSILAYAKVVQGFKAGGFNPVAVSADLQAFDSEKSISYEIGFKTDLLDRRLRFNLAGFIMDRKGTVVEINDPLLPVINLGVNAGKIRAKGIEAEISAVPLEGLRLHVTGGYLNAKFRDFGVGDDEYNGNFIPKTFRYSLSAILTYRTPLTESINLFSFASYRNAWKGYTDNDNLDQLERPELVDVRLGLETDSGWKFGGYVDNLFDNRYAALDIRGDHIPRGTFAPGRTYGIEVSKKF